MIIHNTHCQYFRKNISLQSLPSQQSQAPVNVAAGCFFFKLFFTEF